MNSNRLTANLAPLEKMSPGELATLAQQARALQRAAEAGAVQPLLRAKKVGLLSTSDVADNADDALLDLAASELGAHVAHVRPDLTERSEPHQVADAARMLGRLYDALVCHGLPPAIVGQLSTQAGIPVYDGMAMTSPALAQAIGWREAATPSAEDRRHLLQAVLVRGLA